MILTIGASKRPTRGGNAEACKQAEPTTTYVNKGATRIQAHRTRNNNENYARLDASQNSENSSAQEDTRQGMLKNMLETLLSIPVMRGEA